VLCVDLDYELAKQVAAEIVAAGGHAFACTADLCHRHEVAAVLDKARRRLGGVDLVADVIGHAYWGGVLDIDDQDWDTNFAVNVRQSYLVTQIFGAELAARGTGGALVHVASINGLTGQRGNVGCAAAKAALISLIKTAGLELGPAGIRVNGVAPGAVTTPRLHHALSDTYWRTLRDAIPLGRQAEVADIADAALFLLSDLASYITAQVLVVDGGVSARFPLPDPIFAGAGGSAAQCRRSSHLPRLTLPRRAPAARAHERRSTCLPHSSHRAPEHASKPGRAGRSLLPSWPESRWLPRAAAAVTRPRQALLEDRRLVRHRRA
jgi:NAD(P)-dependent dehydrogenase (short-subunit alcohol dehydrogenase family)